MPAPIAATVPNIAGLAIRNDPAAASDCLAMPPRLTPACWPICVICVPCWIIAIIAPCNGLLLCAAMANCTPRSLNCGISCATTPRDRLPLLAKPTDAASSRSISALAMRMRPASSVSPRSSAAAARISARICRISEALFPNVSICRSICRTSASPAFSARFVSRATLASSRLTIWPKLLICAEAPDMSSAPLLACSSRVNSRTASAVTCPNMSSSERSCPKLSLKSIRKPTPSVGAPSSMNDLL